MYHFTPGNDQQKKWYFVDRRENYFKIIKRLSLTEGDQTRDLF
jgi:hypothetical protein